MNTIKNKGSLIIITSIIISAGLIGTASAGKPTAPMGQPEGPMGKALGYGKTGQSSTSNAQGIGFGVRGTSSGAFCGDSTCTVDAGIKCNIDGQCTKTECENKGQTWCPAV